MEKLSFGASYNYDTRQLGITVPVSLSHGGARVELHAKVDSGASACIFAPGHGELLGLTIETGAPEYFSTATGRFKAYRNQQDRSQSLSGVVKAMIEDRDGPGLAKEGERPPRRRQSLGREIWDAQPA